MVLLDSARLSIGSEMPEFSANTPAGESLSRDDLMGQNGLLIAFTCNHCPYAIAIWPRLVALHAHAAQHSINVVAINPNINPDYPDDSPEAMIKKIDEWGIPFPYLCDTNQSIAKDYGAVCTPDLYLLDANSTLFYHGRLDDNWQQPDAVTQHDLADAITALDKGNPAPSTQYPSMGCSIKWL